MWQVQDVGLGRKDEAMVYRAVLSSLLAVGMTASATAAPPLERAPAEAEGDQLVGMSWLVILALAAGVGISILLSDDDEEEPVSP